MATTIQIQDAIIARIRAKLPDIAAELFPDRPSEYRLNHPVGAVLLSYLRSSYGPALDVGMAGQERTLYLTLTAIARQLNGRDGAITLIDALRAALLGYPPPDCGKILLAQDRFLEEEAGLWKYLIDFTTTTLAVEDAEPESGPVLKHITVADDYGDVEVEHAEN